MCPAFRASNIFETLLLGAPSSRAEGVVFWARQKQNRTMRFNIIL